MEVHRGDTMPTARGPKDWFTGTVWLDRIVEAQRPARVRAVRVSFEPGARTAWHRHPLGQTLHVLLGLGLPCPRRRPASQSTAPSMSPGASAALLRLATPSAAVVNILAHDP